jgi:hypothetical protein
LLGHAPQLAELELVGRDLISLVHPALARLRRALQQAAKAKAKGKRTSHMCMRMKTADKSRIGRSGEAFKWNKTLATTNERDPSADAVSSRLLRAAAVSASTRDHTADVKGQITQFARTLSISSTCSSTKRSFANVNQHLSASACWNAITSTGNPRSLASVLALSTNHESFR